MSTCELIEDRAAEALGLAHVRASRLDTTCRELNIAAWVVNGQVYLFIFREEDRNYLPTILDRFAIDPNLDFCCKDADSLRWDFGCQ